MNAPIPSTSGASAGSRRPIQPRTAPPASAASRARSPMGYASPIVRSSTVDSPLATSGPSSVIQASVTTPESTISASSATLILPSTSTRPAGSDTSPTNISGIIVRYPKSASDGTGTSSAFVNQYQLAER